MANFFLSLVPQFIHEMNNAMIMYFTVIFWANLKADHESIKSKSGVLGFTIRAFLWEGWDLKKVFLTSGTQQMPYMYNILTEPTYVDGALTLSHQLHIIPCLSVTYIRRLFLNTCHGFSTYAVSAYAGLFQVMNKSQDYRLRS